MEKRSYFLRRRREVVFLFLEVLMLNPVLGQEVKELQINYLWTIYNFTQYASWDTTWIASPVLASKHNRDIKWRVKVYPNDGLAEKQIHIGSYLVYECGPFRFINATYKIIILNSDQRKSIKTLQARPYVFAR